MIVKNTKYKQPEMVDMKELAEYIYFDHDYLYRVTSSKEGSVLAKIIISKKNMPLSSFSNIEKRLNEKDWVLKREYNGFYTFCYGVKNRLNIFYPRNNQSKIDLSKDNRLNIDDSSNWVVNFYYRQKGIAECY